MSFQTAKAKSNISLQKISDATGLPMPTLKSFSCGKRDVTGSNLATLLQLCIVMDCTLTDLIGEELAFKYESLMDTYKEMNP